MYPIFKPSRYGGHPLKGSLPGEKIPAQEKIILTFYLE
jgi:hypothetical protein